MSEGRPSTLGRRPSTLLVIGVILALTALRLVHLEADTPVGLDDESSLGTYVDEGYKTLGPRNLVLFGNTRWNPEDDFPGWMEVRFGVRYHWSPLTQWPYYLAFRLLGPSLSSVRLVTVALFTLLLLGYAYATAREYPPPLFFLGLALLGLHAGLFFYSRIALFVMPVTACVYGLVFLLRRFSGAPAHRVLGLIFVFSVVTTLGVRASAPIYMTPIILGFFAARWLTGLDRRSVRIGLGIGFLGLLGLLAFVTRTLWQTRLAFPALPANTLLSPLLFTSTLWVVAGLLCTVHIALAEPRRFLKDPYRAVLVALITVGPAMLGLFTYHPHRYYVPFLPAYALLVLEWFHLGMHRLAPPQRTPWMANLISFLLLTWALFSLAQGLNLAVLREVPIILGAGAGLSDEFMSSIVALVAAALAFGLWLKRHLWLQGLRVATLLAGLLLVSTVLDVYEVGRFLAAPSYRSREISAALRRIVPAEAAVAGDWAPFFALGTDLKVLISTAWTNPPSRLTTLGPEYFLYSDTKDNRRSLERLERLAGVELEPAVFVSSYIGREVRLHPLRYDEKPRLETGQEGDP